MDSFDFKEFKRAAYKSGEDVSVDTVRRAHMSDLGNLEKLACSTTHLLFGDINYGEILDKCHKPMCLENSQDELVAFLCLDDHPNVPSLPPWEWTHWIYNIYHLETITPRNTLWVHLAVWDNRYMYSFLAPMLKATFAVSSFLEYVIMVVPPGVHEVDWLEGQGARIVPQGFSEAHKVQTLYLLVRQHFQTKYKIRRAVEEDNDDLIPLINAYSERLQQYYGEFYVAEILTRHPDAGRKLIVAEYAEHAVAVLFLNEAVNQEALNGSFELIPFYGLRKPHAADVIENPELAVQTSAMALLAEEEQAEEELCSSIPDLKAVSSVGSFESDEVEIALRQTSSEDSADDFSIVDVSSVHFLFDSPKADVDSTHSSESSNYSAMILSFNDYEMHLFADKNFLKVLSFEDLEYHTTRYMKAHAYLPTVSSFHGELNAFTLELAASKPEHEVESLSLLLEAAFECFPDRDYCILTIPSTCPPFPMLNHFVRVTPKPVSMYPHELYVIHRNSMLSKITVRLAVRADIPHVDDLLTNMGTTGMLLANFISAVNEDDDYRAYLMLSQEQVVGVAVLRVEEDFEYLKSHYEIIHWVDENHHKSDSHGLIEHLVLSPIFQRHACFYLREIHRLSDFSVLYYCVHPSDAISLQRLRPLCSVMGDLIPIRPRPMPEFSHSNLEGCAPAGVIHRVDPPFALYVSTSRHCTLSRHEINTKIVIVGSSDIALAFLESLICNWSLSYHIVFTNITVISPHGLNYQKPDNKVRNMMFVTKSNYNYRHMRLTCLRTYVNLVNAAMTGIDRKNKLCIANESSCVAYDLLFLMCGKQFQKPSSTLKDKKQKKITEFPENVFLINTENDATQALIRLKKLIIDNGKVQYKVIVYGCVLEAYCCLASLQEYGVSPSHLIFVESYPNISENVTENHVFHFPDPEVDEAVRETVKAEGIAMYQSYYFREWILHKEGNRIASVKFESRNRRLHINDCIAMFMYNDKTVSARTFLAISKAGLVFDGGLVIGPDCRTNDPSIYAAGTITKYSRRYYADNMAHKYYNLQEIGWKLGQQIRKKLIPFYDEEEDPGTIACELGDMMVPTYEKPLMTYCRLPGNLRYLSVTKPGLQVPLETAMSSEDYGQVLVTGDCKLLEKQGYFRLHLNQFGVIETITCLATFDFDQNNLTSLWGKHQKLLNNLQTRFEMVLITDLFEYFREPWSCAIYHDRFCSLEKNIKKLLTSLTNESGASPLEDLIKMFKENNWSRLKFDQWEELEEKFMNSPYRTELEKLVLDFLRDNDSFLTMYAHPIIVRYLLQGYKNSPLFELQ